VFFFGGWREARWNVSGHVRQLFYRQI